MSTYVDPDTGKKKHLCDADCERICDRCAESYIVHGMYRWGVQSFIECDGGGGLVCDDCATFVLDLLHGGELSKQRKADEP
jgi:hypothetical protein